MEKLLNYRNLIFPVMFLLSLINLRSILDPDPPVLSLGLSLIGITATILFIFNNKWYKLLSRTWIICQMISISVAEHGSEYPVFNLIQTLRLNAGLTLGALTIDFNFLTLLYIALFRMHKRNKMLNKVVSFRVTKYHDELPEKLSGFSRSFINIEGYKYWMRIELQPSVLIQGQVINELIMKTEDGLKTNIIFSNPEGLELGKNNNLSHFRPVDWLINE